MPGTEVWLDIEKALAQGHEAGDARKAILGQVMKLQVVEVHETSEKGYKAYPLVLLDLGDCLGNFTLVGHDLRRAPIGEPCLRQVSPLSEILELGVVGRRGHPFALGVRRELQFPFAGYALGCDTLAGFGRQTAAARIRD